MKPDIIANLNSSDYIVASHCLEELLHAGKISDSDLRSLLALDNKLIIGDFLEKYSDFNKDDLKILETYISDNLDHSDRLFVSDLIEFATSWGLYLPYDKCIGFLNKYGDDDDYVLLSTIEYVFENLRFSAIDDIYRLLYSVLHNTECNQSAQITAAFALFRITGKKEFLSDLIDLVVNGNENNKTLLQNILSLKHNGPDFFDHYYILKAITPLGINE